MGLGGAGVSSHTRLCISHLSLSPFYSRLRRLKPQNPQTSNRNKQHHYTTKNKGGKKTVDLFGGPKRAVTIGKQQGHRSRYGHFDVIVGRHAREEVWPHVAAHLEEHDGPWREEGAAGGGVDDGVEDGGAATATAAAT